MPTHICTHAQVLTGGPGPARGPGPGGHQGSPRGRRGVRAAILHPLGFHRRLDPPGGTLGEAPGGILGPSWLQISVMKAPSSASQAILKK